MSFEDIVAGASPAKVFRKYIEDNPGVTRADLAIDFTDLFPQAGGEAHLIIWNWHGPLNADGMSDEVFDKEIRRRLGEVGCL